VVESGCGPRGRPYTKGGRFTCGVRYLRSSVDRPRKVYELTVTSVWEVGAAGQGGGDVAPFAYDPIEVGATRDVPVGEVQSVVRGD
jgi:enoyl reductase